MSEHGTVEEWIEHAEQSVGITREEALLRLEDGDLWSLHPEQRVVASASAWEAAAQRLADLSDALAGVDERATWALLLDASERGRLLAERARERNAG